MLSIRSLVFVVFAGGVAGCAASTAPYAPPLNSAPSFARASTAQAMEHAWGRSMIRVALPSAGCFEAKYPAIAWERIGCAKPPNIPFSYRKPGAVTPDGAPYVGNTYDWELETLPLPMSGAIGSFDNVRGVKSAFSCPQKNISKKGLCTGGSYGPDSYSLQLNSNNFWTSVCPKHCMGWEQFVYTNYPNYYSNKGGLLIIQDWYLSTDPKKKIKCQKGWTGSGGGCYRNAPFAIQVPSLTAGILGSLTLAGSATANGDSVFLVNTSTGGYPAHIYGMKNAQGDDLTELADHWTGAEYNIFGTGNLARVMFNSGSDITVRVEAITSYTAAPKCLADSGTTGESNNLAFVEAPLHPQSSHYPSVVFREQYPRKSSLLPESCATLPAAY
ncbi:MAG: hypothetical protein JO199_01380 [Candidatus Eremiobacteraeota bacterium]|nr:hypothetical protein [Candidatus Eremiobacteraeota bacterium]